MAETPTSTEKAQCQATCGNNDGTYTDCTLDAVHDDTIPPTPHSFEIITPSVGGES